MDTQRSIVVTGGTSGIGRAAALGFAGAGWRVATCGRRADKVAELRAAGVELAETADVTRPEEVERLFSAVTERFGRIDVVFNNAGAFAPAAVVGDLPVDTWRRMIDVNLNGAFYVAREAFRAMRAQSPQGGRIINNGSISAYAPRPFSSPYTATKHAISGLTRATSLDGRAYNIACGQIDVGNAATEMTERMTAGVLQPRGDKMIEPRMDVQNVADAIVFMATRPLDANALFLNIMATQMPFVGRG